MYTNKFILPYIQVVRTAPEVEVQDAYRVDLLHLTVGVTKVNVLCYGLCHTVKYALKIIKLARVLYLYYYYLALRVLGFYVNTVELIVLTLLITLALQYLDNLHLLTNENGKEAFQNSEVGFLTEQSLNCPVETYVSVLQLYHSLIRY